MDAHRPGSIVVQSAVSAVGNNYAYAAPSILAYWLGAVGTFLLDVFLICGMVYGAASQVASGTLAAGSLLAGFRLKGKQVLALGLIQLIICFVLLMAISAPLAVLFGLLDASPSMQAFLQNTSMQIAALLAIGLVFVMGIMLSIGFTPSLVMLGNVSPVRALAMNVRGGMANLVPLLIYALTMLVFTCALATLFVLFVTIFPQAVTAVLKWWLGLPILIFLGVWNGLIAYAAYLSVWTDTELELELEG